MIRIVGGKIGAGKTLYCVGDMFRDLCAGRTVATNIKLNWDNLAKLALIRTRRILDPSQYVYIDPETSRNWHTVIPFGDRLTRVPVEVYLDEIHMFFNARDWAATEKDNKGLIKFLGQSRKNFVNITFIVQEAETLDKQFRLQAEFELFITTSAHVPLGPLGALPIKFFVVTKISARTRQKLDRKFGSYDKRLFPCYDSFACLDSETQDLADNAVRALPRKLPRINHFRWVFLRLMHSLNLAK